MAANKSQGSFYTLFLAGCTIACSGVFLSGGAIGKLLVVVGVVGIVGSLFGMMQIKGQEGQTAVKPSPEGMKWVGAIVALAGWGVTVVGANMISSTGGRIVLALVGIAISLFGIVVILPAAFNKNAVWKN